MRPELNGRRSLRRSGTRLGITVSISCTEAIKLDGDIKV